MKRLGVTFAAPRRVEIAEDAPARAGPGQVVVRTLVSAISAGTELLVYRGEAPAAMAADDTISALAGDLSFPLRYGYAAVGEVAETGTDVDPTWVGRRVFAFNPHETAFAAATDDLLAIPDGLPTDDAAMLPSMETAVNFLMDGRPMIGERVLLIGQGVVGLLTTGLLARTPLGSLVTVDGIPYRRQASLRMGATGSVDATAPDAGPQVQAGLGDGGADLVYELSGRPEALDLAIAATGYGGRIVIGSWYGTKRAPLDLGGRFHRSRIQVISSQVSTIAPEWTGRWTKARRFETAWSMLAAVAPSHLVTHRIPMTEAARAYRLLDEEPGQAIQVLLTYDS